MGSAAYRRTNADRNITSRDGVTTSQRRGVITSQRPTRVMSDDQNRVTTSQNHLWPDHGLISVAATSHNSLHQIRPLRRGTTARRFTQFRTGCVSHTKDTRIFASLVATKAFMLSEWQRKRLLWPSLRATIPTLRTAAARLF
jgi:hypothetical protein